MENTDKSSEDFNQRKSNYIQQKSGIVKRLQELQNEQGELLSQLIKLSKPTRGPPEWEDLSHRPQHVVRRQLLQGLEPGHCNYEIDNSKLKHISGWSEGRIVIKTGVKWTEPIHPWKIERAQVLQIEQHDLFEKIIKPNYKSKEDIEFKANCRFKHLDSDEDSW